MTVNGFPDHYPYEHPPVVELSADVEFIDGVGRDAYGNTYQHGVITSPEGREFARYGVDDNPLERMFTLGQSQVLPQYSQPQWTPQQYPGLPTGALQQETIAYDSMRPTLSTEQELPSTHSRATSTIAEGALGVFERFNQSTRAKAAALGAAILLVGYPVINGPMLWDKQDGAPADLRSMKHAAQDISGTIGKIKGAAEWVF